MSYTLVALDTPSAVATGLSSSLACWPRPLGGSARVAWDGLWRAGATRDNDPSGLEVLRYGRDASPPLPSLALEPVRVRREVPVACATLNTGTLAARDGYGGLTTDVAGATGRAADIEGAPGSLSPDTWYSVFAYQGAAGVVHLELSTTAPDAARQFKTGSLSRVYVTRFRTDGAGAPLAQRSNGRGVVRYLKRSGPHYDGTGPTTGYTALSLAAAIPPGARFGLIRVTLTGDATWRAIGATPEGDGTPDSGETDVVLPASGRNIEWSSALSGSVSAIVRGYTE